MTPTTLNTWIGRIDSRIAELSKLIYESAAFQIPHPCAHEDAMLLVYFKDVLLRKSLGCGCFENYSESTILSKLNKLL